MRSLCVVALLALACSAPMAQTQPQTPLGKLLAEKLGSDPYYVTGNQLLALKSDRLAFLMYVVGVLDRDNGAQSFWPGLKYCTPDGVTRGQAADVVLRYLEETPAERHMSAAYLVRAAFLKAYPC
jgi:Rap1a immunity proteins